MTRVKEKKKKKLWLRIFLSLLIIGVLASGYFIYQVFGAVDQSYDPLNRKKSDKRDKEVTMDEPFTVLLVGTDVKSAKAKNWRSDTMIVAAVNPKKKSIKMVSVPRDTYAEIANSNGVKTKLNAAPYYGTQNRVGPMTNTVQTLENYLNIPIDYYVKINFSGFIQVVDALGGVDVDVPFNFNMRLFYKWYTFKQGPTHLDGHEALAYVRMRKSDPRGDAGRNERQREVVQNLMSQAVSLNSVSKIDDVLKAVGDNVSHNMKVSEMYKLQSTYRSIPKDRTETLKVQGYDSKDNPQGIWYHYINDNERLRISHILQKELELPLETLDGQKFQGQSPAEEGADQTEGTPERGNGTGSTPQNGTNNGTNNGTQNGTTGGSSGSPGY
ncbi:LCP family protein [Salinithrix halophila]|uniref:LCP family protein n=1 Tax=Salinithrix halophila TaxID=1485204 RepID=A0ABV8JEQ2_9BACL